ncbi:MAG: hypothetical protein ACI9S8_001665 [Chlamydiales bacterium]|jgi:hypothetical protein
MTVNVFNCTCNGDFNMQGWNIGKVCGFVCPCCKSNAYDNSRVVFDNEANGFVTKSAGWGGKPQEANQAAYQELLTKGANRKPPEEGITSAVVLALNASGENLEERFAQAKPLRGRIVNRFRECQNEIESLYGMYQKVFQKQTICSDDMNSLAMKVTNWDFFAAAAYLSQKNEKILRMVPGQDYDRQPSFGDLYDNNRVMENPLKEKVQSFFKRVLWDRNSLKEMLEPAAARIYEDITESVVDPYDPRWKEKKHEILFKVLNVVAMRLTGKATEEEEEQAMEGLVSSMQVQIEGTVSFDPNDMPHIDTDDEETMRKGRLESIHGMLIRRESFRPKQATNKDTFDDYLYYLNKRYGADITDIGLLLLPFVDREGLDLIHIRGQPLTVLHTEKTEFILGRVSTLYRSVMADVMQNLIELVSDIDRNGYDEAEIEGQISTLFTMTERHALFGNFFSGHHELLEEIRKANIKVEEFKEKIWDLGRELVKISKPNIKKWNRKIDKSLSPEERTVLTYRFDIDELGVLFQDIAKMEERFHQAFTDGKSAYRRLKPIFTKIHLAAEASEWSRIIHDSELTRKETKDFGGIFYDEGVQSVFERIDDFDTKLFSINRILFLERPVAQKNFYYACKKIYQDIGDQYDQFYNEELKEEFGTAKLEVGFALFNLKYDYNIDKELRKDLTVEYRETVLKLMNLVNRHYPIMERFYHNICCNCKMDGPANPLTPSQQEILDLYAKKDTFDEVLRECQKLSRVSPTILRRLFKSALAESGELDLLKLFKIKRRQRPHIAEAEEDEKMSRGKLLRGQTLDYNKVTAAIEI